MSATGRSRIRDRPNARIVSDTWAHGVITGKIFAPLLNKWIYSVKIGDRIRHNFTENDLQWRNTVVFNVGDRVRVRGKDGSTWSGPGAVSGRDFDEVKNKWFYSVTNPLGSVFDLTADDLQLLPPEPISSSWS